MTNITIGPAKPVQPIVVGTGSSPASSSVVTNPPVSAAQPVIITPPGPKGDKGDPGDDGIMAIYSLPLAP